MLDQPASDERLINADAMQQLKGEEHSTALFAKDTWGPVQRFAQPESLGALSHNFGAPKLWRNQESAGNDFYDGHTGSTVSWVIFVKQQDKTGTILCKKISVTTGVSSHRAKTPYELLVRVFEDMIGEYCFQRNHNFLDSIFFCKAHYAHHKKQNIADHGIIGNNSLYLPKSEKRNPPELYVLSENLSI